MPASPTLEPVATRAMRAASAADLRPHPTRAVAAARRARRPHRVEWRRCWRSVWSQPVCAVDGRAFKLDRDGHSATRNDSFEELSSDRALGRYDALSIGSVCRAYPVERLGD